MLTKENLNSLFEYKDGALFWKVQPSQRTKAGERAGSVNSRGYRTIRCQSKNIREHRAIFVMHYGYDPEIVDHINGDKLDNRIENLRAATKSSNMMNSVMPSKNTSVVKGVSWKKELSKWYAQIRVKGVVVWNQYFTELSDAAEAVKQARIKYHGEFANHG